MKAILIDTTGSSLAVVLVVGDKTFSVQKDVGKSGHSAILMPTIDALFAKNNIKIDDIDTVGVVVGPGSFTGIRIGVATATALAFSLNAKRIAVTSFELLAYSRQKATVAVDAGHGNLYVADCEDGKVKSTRFIEGDEAKSVDKSKFEFETVLDVATTLVEVAKAKANAGEYVNVFEPFYMRKSQAEREKGV
ncbi:MAG: tRNA (adenosine(37)-N6)-threonylcarbamoyltransferase complex dimerization subunit type 1 TsaB [Clostridia bacterium]|nr:tRNA (adenosine(37)-N6)-threonylcarbamoyltransferase complex dimerization subunit type 1 TsaB [Clostridia bacterium]